MDKLVREKEEKYAAAKKNEDRKQELATLLSKMTEDEMKASARFCYPAVGLALVCQFRGRSAKQTLLPTWS